MEKENIWCVGEKEKEKEENICYAEEMRRRKRTEKDGEEMFGEGKCLVYGGAKERRRKRR